MTIVALAMLLSGDIYAQFNWGDALGKIGGAIEKRYNSQKEKEREIERNKVRTSYEPQSWNLKYEGICYDCRTYSNNSAIVTNGVQKYIEYTYAETENRQRPKEGAIHNHRWLDYVYIPNTITYKVYGKKGRLIKSTECTVTKMVEGAFYQTSAKKVSITGNIEEIPKNAFRNSSVGDVFLNFGTKSIGEYAFDNCRSLYNITLPSSLSLIDQNAFSSCVSLRNVVFPSRLHEIRDYAFYNCTNLGPVITIPDSAEYLRKYSFANCPRLNLLYLPSKLMYLEDGLIVGTNIIFFYLPPRIRSIGNYIFAHPGGLSIDGLREPTISKLSILVSVSKVPPRCSENTFYGIDFNKCLLLVPNEAIDTYKYSYGWSQFKNIMHIPDSILVEEPIRRYYEEMNRM